MAAAEFAPGLAMRDSATSATPQFGQYVSLALARKPHVGQTRAGSDSGLEATRWPHAVQYVLLLDTDAPQLGQTGLYVIFELARWTPPTINKMIKATPGTMPSTITK
jgi:hypothetical protein